MAATEAHSRVEVVPYDSVWETQRLKPLKLPEPAKSG